MTTTLHLNREQQAMLNGDAGMAKQMAMRLVVDMAAAAGADALTPIHSAHLSGVSPLTGGLGLRHFLARLAADPDGQVAVPTTLNAAGCDVDQFAAMRIVTPDFLEHSQEIINLYVRLGVQPTQSCIPYEWEGVVVSGPAAWAESNAICFGNSYTGLLTNRESGLSALAAALTGYAPQYGLLLPESRQPNLEVAVACDLDDPTDFSILGDWVGSQKQTSWSFPLGPIPLITGLPASLTHEQRKALTAAAANYGCPLLYIAGHGDPPETGRIQGRLTFTADHLAARYAALAPRQPISLIVIGCPQASVGELRAAAALLQGQQALSAPGGDRPPLWIFTSAANLAIAEKTGLAAVIRGSGALLLANTCPEVVPYDPSWVKHVLTNSMKAEHYIKSGLNGIPTAVMRLADCIAIATGQESMAPWPDSEAPLQQSSERTKQPEDKAAAHAPTLLPPTLPAVSFSGQGLPSQGNFIVRGEAFVTEVPITLLGFVNRQTGVIEEPGHPAHGQSMAGKIAIFPKGSGSTVAPYVLLELYYRGMAPLAVVNTDIDQQSAPACSLEGIPYAYGFDPAVLTALRSGDMVELRRHEDAVTMERLVNNLDTYL